MTPLFTLDWMKASLLDRRLGIACPQALAAGVPVGVLCNLARAFPMGSDFHIEGFDFRSPDMVLPTEEFGSFKNATYFASREAKHRNWMVLLDCAARTITPLAPELVDPNKMKGLLPEPVPQRPAYNRGHET